MADTTITFGDDEFNDPPMGDMEGLDESTQYDTSFDFGDNVDDPFTQRPGEDPVFTAADVPKSPKDKSKDDIDKIVAQKVKEVTQKNKEKADEEKKRLKKESRREDARERRQFQRQKKRDGSEASERRKQIRQDAVTKRVQAYSVTAALGLPGYIGASLIDQFILRPREEAAMEAENDYQRDYQEYIEAVEDERISRKENNEDYIDSIRPADVDAAYIKKQLTKNLEKGKDYNPRSKGFTASGSFQKSGGAGRKSVDEEIVDTLLADKEALTNKLKELAKKNEEAKRNVPQGTTPPTVTSAGNSNNGSGGSGGNSGGLTPPQPPQPPSNNVSVGGHSFDLVALGQVAMLAGGVIKASQVVNSYIESTSKSAQQYSKSLLTQDDPGEYMKSSNKLSQKIYDPLGVNVPVQVITSGMDTLLSLTQDIRDYAKKDIAFSPMALTASIEGSIEKLMKTIELGTKTDPVRAGIIEVWTEFEIVFMELKAYFITTFGPAMLANLRILLTALKVGDTVVSQLNSLLQWTGPALTHKMLGSILEYVAGIKMNTDPDNPKSMPNNITQQIEDFMNPGKQRIKIQQAFPNFVW